MPESLWGYWKPILVQAGQDSFSLAFGQPFYALLLIAAFYLLFLLRRAVKAYQVWQEWRDALKAALHEQGSYWLALLFGFFVIFMAHLITIPYEQQAALRKQIENNWITDVLHQPLPNKTMENRLVFTLMSMVQKPIPVKLRLTTEKHLSSIVSDVQVTASGQPVVNLRWELVDRTILIDFDGPGISPISEIELAIQTSERFTLLSIERWGKPSSPLVLTN